MNSSAICLEKLECRGHLSSTLSPTSPQTGLAQSTAHLSQERGYFHGATVGNKMLFAGGETPSGMSDVVDIYDAKTRQWSTARLSQPRYQGKSVTVGEKVLFAGGVPDGGGLSDVVDVYDDSTGQWAVTHLPHPDAAIVLAVGSKVIFAGGQGQGAHLSTADIYDSDTGAWSTVNLPLRSFSGGAIIVGRYAFFTANGGLNVYDTLSGRWSAVAVAKAAAVGTVVGSEIVTVSGEIVTNGKGELVNTYDLYTQKISTGQLSQLRTIGGAATLGRKVIFAGGLLPAFGPFVDTVDVYDTLTKQWSVTTLSVARFGIATATLGTQAFFAGGNGGPTDFSDAVDIFTDTAPAPVLGGYIVRGDDAPLGTASVTMRNSGDNALAGPFAVTIYGARPGRKSVVLGSVTARRALRVGESRTLAVGLTIPPGTTLADYHLSAATDAGAGEAIFAAELDLGHFTGTLLPPAQVAQADKSTTFSVAFHSPFAIDASTLDDNDIIVTGPNGFEAHAQFVSQTPGRSRTTRIATYAVHAAGRRWDISDNGDYAIHLQDGQVTDAAGNAPPSDRLGTFTVAILNAPAVRAGATSVVQRSLTTFKARRSISDLFEF